MIPPPNAFASWASTATPAGVVGAIVGLFAWESFATAPPCAFATACESAELDIGLFEIPSQLWAAADFGFVGVLIGLGASALKPAS